MRARNSTRLHRLERAPARQGNGRCFVRYADAAWHAHPGGWYLGGEPTSEAPRAGDSKIEIVYTASSGHAANDQSLR